MIDLFPLLVTLLWNILGDDSKLLIGRLHCREQEHFFDVVLVRQEHGQAIHSEPKATRWWQSVFESCHKRIVQNHGFVITGTTGLGLLQKEFVLYHRIVQLGVCIGKLHCVRCRIKIPNCNIPHDQLQIARNAPSEMAWIGDTWQEDS